MKITSQKYKMTRRELDMLVQACDACTKMVRPKNMDVEMFKRFTYAMGRNFNILMTEQKVTEKKIAEVIGSDTGEGDLLEVRLNELAIGLAMTDEAGAVMKDPVSGQLKMTRENTLEYQRKARLLQKEAEALVQEIFDETVEVSVYRFDFADVPDVVLGSWLWAFRHIFDNVPVLPPQDEGEAIEFPKE